MTPPARERAGRVVLRYGPRASAPPDPTEPPATLPLTSIHQLSHSVDRKTGAGQGTYVLPWEAHVGNLRYPSRGSITIRVAERPAAPFELNTVAAVMATREVPVREE